MSTLLDLQNGRETDRSAPAAEVPRPRFRWWSRVVIPAAVLATGASLLLVSAWDSLVPASQVQVETAVIKSVRESRPAGSQVQAAGWLEASPYLRHVSALTGGVLDEVLVLEGQQVKKGQVVARMVIDDADLEVLQAKATLALRKAAVGEAKARRDAAEMSWKYPVALEREAAVFAAQQRVAVAAVAASEAGVQEQKVVLAQARRDAKRAEKLVKTSIISKQQAEEAQNKLLVAEATLVALKKAQQKAEAEARRVEAQALAAKTDLKLRINDQRERAVAAAVLKRAEAEVQVAEARLALAELRRKRMEIVSTFDGIVVKRLKEPGDKVMLNGDEMRSATIVSVYDPSKLQARVDVPLADAAKIAVGQRCEVVTEVLPNRRFAGRVDRILHSADIQKNTLQVKVILDAPTAELRPEMLCRARFLAQPKKETDPASATEATAVFAPKSAIREGKLWILSDYNGHYGVAKPIAATVASELDGWVAVDGLNPGDQIITSSSTPLKQGQRVRLAKEAN